MPIIPFTNVGQALHHGYINAVSVCAWKPIFLTSGQDDKTVRLWNYESQELELVKYYQEDIFSLCLHPTGKKTFVTKYLFLLFNIEKKEISQFIKT